MHLHFKLTTGEKMDLLQMALVPPILLLVYIYCRDKYQREPIPLLLKAFFAGFILVTAAAIILELLVEAYVSPFVNSKVWLDVFSTAISAPIIEETCKFLTLYVLFWKNPYFDEYFDGIVYAVYVSLGFAAAENILYVLPAGKEIAILRGIFAVPGHFFFAVLMGYFFALAKFSPSKSKFYLMCGLGSAMMAHSAYNFACSVAHWNEILVLFAILGVSICLWILGVKKIRRLSEMSYKQMLAQKELLANSQPGETEFSDSL